MSVSLFQPSIFAQLLTTGGLNLNAGLIYTYIAGGTTPQATYTTSAGNVANANPIVLGADGRPPSEIWLTDAASYRFDVKDSLGNLIKTYDNISAPVSSVALAASSGSSLGGYIASGSGAVATTMQSHLQQWYSVFDFMSSTEIAAVRAGTSTGDDTAIMAAIAAASSVYYPKGTYLMAGNGGVITKAVRMEGENASGTVIERGYSPSNDYDGIFSLQGGSSATQINNMTLRSKTGQTGGCVLSVKAALGNTIGLISFSNVDFTTTGTDTHKFTIWADGTAASGAPIGIRGFWFKDCSVFGAATYIMKLLGVSKFGFTDGQIQGSGGTATTILLDGTVGVPFSGRITPSEISAGIDFDHVAGVVIVAETVGTITNTSNGNAVYGVGYVSATIPSNWSQSYWLNPRTNNVDFSSTIGLKCGATAATLTNVWAQYSQLNDRIYFAATFTVSNLNGGVGNVTISGLPVTAKNTTNAAWVVNVKYGATTPGAGVIFNGGTISANGSAISLNVLTQATGVNAAMQETMLNAGSTTINVTGEYQV